MTVILNVLRYKGPREASLLSDKALYKIIICDIKLHLKLQPGNKFACLSNHPVTLQKCWVGTYTCNTGFHFRLIMFNLTMNAQNKAFYKFKAN